MIIQRAWSLVTTIQTVIHKVRKRNIRVGAPLAERRLREWTIERQSDPNSIYSLFVD